MRSTRFTLEHVFYTDVLTIVSNGKTNEEEGREGQRTFVHIVRLNQAYIFKDEKLNGANLLL